MREISRTTSLSRNTVRKYLRLVVGGVYRKLQLAHMKLCASRAFWLTAYPSQGHEMLFDAPARGFAALGVARRGIYDNMKTAVDVRWPRRTGALVDPAAGTYTASATVRMGRTRQRHDHFREQRWQASTTRSARRRTA